MLMKYSMDQIYIFYCFLPRISGIEQMDLSCSKEFYSEDCIKYIDWTLSGSMKKECI